MKIGVAAAIIVLMAISSVITYVVIDPVGKTSLAQRAILSEYVKLYCHPSAKLQPFRNDNGAAHASMVGQMALVSRMAIDARLGPLVMAEWAKCKGGYSYSARKHDSD